MFCLFDLYINIISLFLQRESEAGRAGKRRGGVSFDRGRRRRRRQDMTGNNAARLKQETERKIVAWTKTSTPTPAALAASSLREGTAAGLLGEMWDGQGECRSANPQGEGGEMERFQWGPFHFHPPPPPPLSWCHDCWILRNSWTDCTDAGT